ncbi:uncharacterized protein TNCV_4997961 [Trichonephila clavipes]|nr:uncharacterized protein TNCV_4997961 [Trichonephila clavipes]
MVVTRVEQRTYIKIAVLRGINAMECHSELVEPLGNNALPYHTVARWVAKFQQGRVSTTDEQRGAANADADGFWEQVLCEVNDAQNYLQTEGLNIHQCSQKIRALQTVSEAKREEFVYDGGLLIYAKSLREELENSFEPPKRIRRKHIFGDGSKDVQLSYEEDLRRTMFFSIDRVTAEIRERFQQLQNLAQKYAFLRPEVILSMEELNL